MPRRAMNGHRVHVILTGPQYKATKRLSEKSGLGTSEIIRRAIDEYLGKLRKRT